MIFLLFDLDDTILSYDGVSDQAWEEACQKYASHFLFHSSDQIKNAIQEAGNWYWSDQKRHREGRLNLQKARRDVVGMALEKLNIDTPDLANMIADYFTLRREELIHPFPGAIETLQKLNNMGVVLGMVTNGAKKVQQAKIDRFDLKKYFKAIAIEGEFGCGKPESEIFTHVLKQLNANTQQTYMIGDSLEYDIAGAGRLGIKTIWNNWSKKQLPEGTIKPDIEISSINQIFNHIPFLKTPLSL
jgi:putative hydrolase of the HAD superfamily